MDIGYKSPIEIIAGDIQTKYEDDIIKAVQSFDINVDKERLIKALDYDKQQFLYGYNMALATIRIKIENQIRTLHSQDYNGFATLQGLKEFIGELQSIADEQRERG